MFARLLLLATVGLALSCRTADGPGRSDNLADLPGPGFEVARVREDLQVAPLEMVWSGVRGQAEAQEALAIRNVGKEPVQVSAIEIVGAQAPTFRIVEAPALPLLLPAGQGISVTLGFRPAANAEPGPHRATLRVYEGPHREEAPPVDLSGLVLKGRQGNKEPPLQQVVDALGFATNVGGNELHLGTGAAPIGDEVRGSRWKRVRKSQVSLYPVARFSPDEPIPYGYYLGDGSKSTQLAVIPPGQEQTLNPELEPDGITTFDPGDQPFGLWVRSGKHTTYTDDALNVGQTRHAARIYPLSARGGGRIPDAYLVAFEEAANGDYQDYVFVMWNVQIVPPAP